jgi:hypothetical protein
MGNCMNKMEALALHVCGGMGVKVVTESLPPGETEHLIAGQLHKDLTGKLAGESLDASS